jgi:hypothetical protein
MGFHEQALDTCPHDGGNPGLTYHRGHRSDRGLPVGAEMEQSTGDHVTGSAAEGIKDKEPHKSPVPINPCVYDF